MGDRCYMTLTCRPQDVEVFEAIGFGVEDDDLGPGAVEMVDEEANYANRSEMPTDRVYFGFHGAGDTYGPERFACDGEQSEWQICTSDGSLIVLVDEDDRCVTPIQMKLLGRFLDIEARAKAAIFPETEESPNHEARIV